MRVLQLTSKSTVQIQSWYVSDIVAGDWLSAITPTRMDGRTSSGSPSLYLNDHSWARLETFHQAPQDLSSWAAPTGHGGRRCPGGMKTLDHQFLRRATFSRSSRLEASSRAELWPNRRERQRFSHLALGGQKEVLCCHTFGAGPVCVISSSSSPTPTAAPITPFTRSRNSMLP